VVTGTDDHTVPPVITKATLKLYRQGDVQTDMEEFDNRGDSLVVDHGWRDIAGACLIWLQDHQL
jgi:hypothetical protein